ncbi:two-component response regulator [Erythrobacter sp. NAP1]|uniref:LytR/AlgR family response regulator transcription factor n=1 Tax=Erythrobacter sp. NAP1 TaxID=237727 RepID=UPI000068518B|nr:LytTR family DNA-binding domain-containing protein [Erythrobacter sp. NAP1]EAQ27878.1 two-component response regulator [Erythrobacter sp. NAP1]
MKPLRVFIADDEPLALRRVLRSVKSVDDTEIVGTASDGKEALAVIAATRPDLLLLDIMMPGLTGFELLEHLDEDQTPSVIFITAFDNFAVDAFAQGVVDYILKPLDDTRLAQAIERARERMELDANQERFAQLRSALSQMNTDFSTAIPSPYERDIWVRENGVVRRVRVEDIDWIEAANDYVSLHTAGGQYLADDSIRSLAKRLNPDQFFQVHRGAIVRIQAISEINREKFSAISLTLKSGARVRVSKSFKRAVFDALKL